MFLAPTPCIYRRTYTHSTKEGGWVEFSGQKEVEQAEPDRRYQQPADVITHRWYEYRWSGPGSTTRGVGWSERRSIAATWESPKNRCRRRKPTYTTERTCVHRAGYKIQLNGPRSRAADANPTELNAPNSRAAWSLFGELELSWIESIDTLGSTTSSEAGELTTHTPFWVYRREWPCSRGTEHTRARPRTNAKLSLGAGCGLWLVKEFFARNVRSQRIGWFMRIVGLREKKCFPLIFFSNFWQYNANLGYIIFMYSAILHFRTSVRLCILQICQTLHYIFAIFFKQFARLVQIYIFLKRLQIYHV